MSYTEDDLIPLSAIQHLFFCERQCALIHIEQVWEENRLTAEGRIMHEKAHEIGSESRGSVRIERGLPLRSLKLGLIGKADVVEFHREEEGKWQPFPVEYKRGKPKPDACDKVQLCAQAMCLEEMLGIPVPSGAIYYGRIRHRLEVVFDDDLRTKTVLGAQKVRQFIDSGRTPEPVYSKKCKSCSLVEVCLPKTAHRRRSVDRYLQEARRGREETP